MILCVTFLPLLFFAGILVSAANSKDIDDAIDIEMQSDMLIILSSLCEGDIHRKELFDSEGHGIDIVTHYLKMDPTKFTSGLGHHRLMLATVDAVWSVEIWCHLRRIFYSFRCWKVKKMKF